jgi:hypothetical protein
MALNETPKCKETVKYQTFWEVVGLEWGPLSLVRIIEDLLERTVWAPV